MRIELVVKQVFEVKSAVGFYLETFIITILAQVHQSHKLSRENDLLSWSIALLCHGYIMPQDHVWHREEQCHH